MKDNSLKFIAPVFMAVGVLLLWKAQDIAYCILHFFPNSNLV